MEIIKIRHQIDGHPLGYELIIGLMMTTTGEKGAKMKRRWWC